MRAPRRLIPIVALGLAASSGLGCWAISKRDADVDRAPVVNHGAGATVIYPGQAAPPHPGNYHPRQAGYGAQPSQSGSAPAHAPQPGTAQGPAPQGAAAHLPPDAVAAGVAQPPPEYASRTGSPAPARGSNVTMIGGAEQEITKHISINEEPGWLKYAALPFAVVAAPFQYGYEKVRGEPGDGPAVPRNDSQPRPERAPQPQYGDTGTATPSPGGPTAPVAPPPNDYESARLQGLERELAQRQAAPPPAYGPPPSSGASGATSIADELARLRQQSAQPRPPSQVAMAPRRQPQPGGVEQASPQARSARSEPQASEVDQVGQVDRDGDGRPDHWIERRGGAVVAERFDDDFDSRPDRTLVYDPATHEVIRIEEDTDHDGRIDSWTTLRNGQLAARRTDGDGDGTVDSWSHYREGIITRLERDADGDGFRDLVAYYRNGRLDREERDGDADGMTDLVRYYDDGERVERVEEDADGDGEMDVVSHYEGGRLTRREVLDASVLEPN